MKKIVNYFKSLRKSTIYKLVGVLLLIGIIIWMVMMTNKINNLTLKKSNIKSVSTFSNNKKESDSNIAEVDNDVKIIESENKSYKSNENIVKSNPKSSNKPEIKINEQEIINSNESVNDNINLKEKYADAEVLSFLKETNNNLDNSILQEQAKENFIIIIDFLFYNGEIKGYTFDELTTKTKLSVIKLVLTIDNKIDSYFPDYKEKISEKTNKIYTSIKELAITKYLEITTSICKKDSEICEQAKQDFQDMKKSFSITWDLIKNVASVGKENIKTWYEIYSGK